MEINAFVEDFDHYRKTSLLNTFGITAFSSHLLVEHLSMADSIKLEIM